MSKNVVFHLGPAVGLSQRVLTIRRMMRAGDASNPAAEITATLSGSAESTTQVIPDNQIWQATLVDTRTSGEVSGTDVLNFHTGSLQFPGPRSEDRLAILSMEDLSSSSSVSSSSVSSSSPSSLSSASSSSSHSSSSSSTSSSTSASSLSSSSPSSESSLSSASSLSSSSESSSSSSSSSSS